MPMMAKGTAAIMKGQRKVRRRPKLSVNSFSPKVAIGVPLAARSLVGDGETTSSELRGMTLTSAPVSTRNSMPEVKSLTRMRRLWCWPVASVAVTDRPRFPCFLAKLQGLIHLRAAVPKRWWYQQLACLLLELESLQGDLIGYDDDGP
ncbi:unnamed protein product, partial [Dicrocoelium dendriticum]